MPAELRVAHAARTVVIAIAALLSAAVPAQALPGDSAFESTGLTGAAQQLVAAAAAPPGVTESVVWSGLTAPTAISFAPDGRVFVAEKAGRIKVFDSIADPTPTIWADFSVAVHDFWDRGFLGMALDPNFATRPYVYALYPYNKAPNSSQVPRWPDSCPTPPGATDDGCVVTGRLSRFTADGTETVLIEDFCQQYPSHSTGSLAFGQDGALYVSSGDGASFNWADYGQDGNPLNPCGDPPAGAGGAMTPPTAEGGALRSQDVRTTADPTGLDGAILRVNPDTGQALPGNPNAGSSDANARRIVAHGLRNPFRITVRPGTNEVWAGDVGWNTWEEINRVVDPTAPMSNFGWPCYEGNARQGGYDNLNLNLCETLYAQGVSAHATPYYTYNHGARPVLNEACPTGSSSISGLAFYPAGGSLGPAYEGALFFSDYSRNCIWVMLRGSNGLPDPAQIQTFQAGAAGPVQLTVGPGGDVYYVDMSGGTIRRFRGSFSNATPSAVATATPTSGQVPLTVSFDGGASSDPNAGDTLSYAWDLDGDGQFDDSMSATPSRTYTTPAVVTVRLRVTDQGGLSDSDTVTVTAGTAPTATIGTPSAGTTWRTGDRIIFSGSASDFLGAPITGTGLTWRINLQHCNRQSTSCHTHVVQSLTGPGGEFDAPAHEYPSYLELELTATDSHGLSRTVTRRLDPLTVPITMQSTPPGAELTLGTETVAAPYTLDVIQGSRLAITAPVSATIGGVPHDFAGWSDGGGRTHDIVPGSAPATYTATFSPPAADPSLVAAYAFSEGGASVADLSGRGNHGTVSGATWSAAGRHGGGLSFDGVNDLVTVPDASSLDLTSGMTLMGWVRPTAVAGWRTVLLKEQPGNLAYALYGSGTSGRPSGYVYVGGDRGVDGTAAVAVNAWTHVATTYDGSVLRLFVNGTQVATRTLGGAMTTSTGALRIGGNNVWGEWFAGLIDEIRVYNRALTAASIQADMATPIGGSPPPPTLAVSPAALSFTATAGGADPAAKSLSVSHDLGTLSWTASTDAPWLQVTPAGGASPATVSVRPSIAGLAAGSYTGTVTVSAAGAQGSPKQIAVTLTVEPPPPPVPVLSVTPSSLAFNATEGGAAPPSQSLTIANTGTGTLQWTAQTAQPWLQLSTAAGTGAGTVGVSIQPTGLAPGTYNGTIRVTAAGAQGSPKDIPVSLTVSSAQAGLVGAFGFNEGQGSAVADASGRGNPGTISGAAWSDAGRFGKALTFDGVDDWVTVPDTNPLDLATGMTIEAWVNPSTLGGWRTVLLKERPNQLSYGIYASGDVQRPSGWVSMGPGDLGTNGTAAVATNAWTHLAATYDGSTLRLWVNGVNVSSRAVTGAIASSTMPLRIGGNSVWGEFFAGRIDEVRVYNRALTAPEIAADRDTPVGG